MPEARDLMARGRGAAGELSGGYFISRVMSPGAMAAAAAGPRRARNTLEDGKENNRFARPARLRKNPLPSWYPRTPLRDITAIVNALEMRRARVRAARAQQRNFGTEATPRIAVSAIPSPQDQIPPIQGCSSDATSDSSPSSTPTTTLTNTPFSAQHQLPSSSTPASFSPFLQPPSTPTDLKLAEPLQALCNSMDEIEKAAKEYLKKAPKEPARRTAQRALMSMR